MNNTIVIDTDELAKQQEAVNNSDMDEVIKEGLNEMFSTIRDMEDDFKLSSPLTFILLLKEDG